MASDKAQWRWYVNAVIYFQANINRAFLDQLTNYKPLKGDSES
jgi:hypothetical protein